MSKTGEAPHTISVSGEFYEKLEREAERRGIAVSSLVEAIIAPALGVKPPRVRAFRKRRSRNV